MPEQTRPSVALSRRDFVRAGTAGLATWAILGRQPAAGNTSRAVRGAAARVLPLATAWRFGGRLGERRNEESVAPAFDDSDFDEVTLPHCATELSWRNWESETWEDRFIYRRRFDLPEPLRGVRIFLDFAGSLTGTTPTINGRELEKHLGGYLPFSYEITEHVTERDNLLAVVVDGRLLNVPPALPGRADSADYLQPAGLYREVSLRVVPQVFLADLFAKPVDVLDAEKRRVAVQCTLDAGVALERSGRVTLELCRDSRVVGRAEVPVELDAAGRVTVEATIRDLGDIELWDVDDPQLYDVVATLVVDDQPLHDYRTRIGFREARFEVDGFFLNGRRLKLFGLNRHQLYPYVGMAMPARVQRKDAEILKRDYNCNTVRCSHYPQSEHFLDACDELGLLVWEEIPGWKPIGDEQWQEFVLRDTEEMILRDRNRPSIVIWGVQINHSRNMPDLYTRTREIARSVDDSRPTSGGMSRRNRSLDQFKQDVFGQNHYFASSIGNATLEEPLPGIPYLVTEAVGQFNYFKPEENFTLKWRRDLPAEIQGRHALLHAQVHNVAGTSDRYLGVQAWCAFDYASLRNASENIKWPGIADTFRIPKLGAAFYLSQVDPRVRPVIEPSFYWDFGAESPPDGPGERAMICSNCDRLEIYVDGRHRVRLEPDRENLGHLRYPPFFADLSGIDGEKMPELRLDGYVGQEKVVSRKFSSDPAEDQLLVAADDEVLVADGSDATRVVLRVVDRYEAPRPYAGGEVRLELEGPGTLIGDNPFVLDANGGAGAVWVRADEGQGGTIRVVAVHPTLERRVVSIRTEAPGHEGE